MPNSVFVGQIPNRRPQVTAGDSTSVGSPGIIVAQSTTVVGNAADTNEATAWTYTVPANLLAVDGDHLRIFVRFNAAANANNKRFRIYFGGTGGTAVWDSTSVGYNGSTFPVTVNITRLTATTQRASSSGSSATGGTAVNVSLSSSPAQTLTGPVDITVTVQSPTTGAANDALFSDGYVEFLPGPF